MNDDVTQSLGAPPTDRRWGLVASALATVVLVVSWLTYDPVWVMNDATQAMSVACHLAAGDGIVTDIIYYREQYATGQVPAPQTVFPPGYPLLIAPLLWLGLPAGLAAYTVASTCFASVAVLLMFAARRLGLSFAVGTLVAVIWCGCMQCWDMTWGLMSEMPFIALTLGSLVAFTDRDPARLRWLLLSGIAAAGAFTIRYAGMFWFITVAAFFAMELLRRPQWHTLKSALAWGAFPTMTLAGLFWRNHSLSGEWTGGNPIGNQRPLIDSLLKIREAIQESIGFAKLRLFTGGVAEWLMIIGVLTIIVGLLWQWRGWRVDRIRGAAAIQRPRLLLSVGYLVVSMTLLLYLNSRSPIGLGPRKLLPLLPFSLLVVSSLLKTVRFDSAVLRRLVSLASIVLVIAAVWGQHNVWKWISKHPRLTWGVVESLERPVDGQTLRESLQASVTADAPLLTNEPHRVYFSIERPVLGLPGPVYSDLTWTDEEVKQLVESYGVREVIVFARTLETAEFPVPFFLRLVEGRVPDWLHASAIEGDVYTFTTVDERLDRESLRNRHALTATVESP